MQTVYRLKQIAYTLEVLRKEKTDALSLLVPGANDGKEDRLRQFLMREKAISNRCRGATSASW